MKTLGGIHVFAGALFTAPWLFACSSTQNDWQQANAANTVAAYQAFLSQHPNSQQSITARFRIHALEDEQAWARAQQASTAQAFANYMQQEPTGIHTAEAKDRIAATERSTAWTAASSADTPEALQAFLEKYPQGPQADQARTRIAQLTGYQVQLASFRSEQQAERTRSDLQDKYGNLLGSVVVVPEATGDLHVVRSAPMSQDEANTACATLKKAHLPCEVIKAVNS